MAYDPYQHMDMTYLKQLAAQQNDTGLEGQLADAVGTLRKNQVLDVKGHPGYFVPPMIARDGAYTSNIAAPENDYRTHDSHRWGIPNVEHNTRERANPLTDQYLSGDEPHSSNIPSAHGADLQVPYRYDPDMQQRMTDKVLSTYANLVKHLTPSK